MKIIGVNTSDNRGGAAIAALRLTIGVRALGVDAELWVQRKHTNLPFVRGSASRAGHHLAQWRLLFDQLPVLGSLKWRDTQFSPAWFPGLSQHTLRSASPSLIHLHWIGKGFVRIESMATWAWPIVWTLHDMWPFTGGCHYDDDCGRYSSACGTCPVLGGRRQRDASDWVLRRKRRAWDGRKIVAVSPSRWLAGEARRSTLFERRDVRVIPNGIDCSTYRVMDRETCRARLGLSADTRLIAFGAMNAADKRKGFGYLVEAINILAARRHDLMCVIYGATTGSQVPLPIPVRYSGTIESEDAMISLLNAADVFVAPSVQDNFPNTIAEALACGCPVVAFDVGGISEMVDHCHNGYLAKPGDSISLADGLNWVLGSPARQESLRHHARERAERDLSLPRMAEAYRDLYVELTGE